jgi:hypothetical protein
MSGKKEFGVKYDTEVTDMGVPRDDGVLEAEWCWGVRAASGEYIASVLWILPRSFHMVKYRSSTDVAWDSRLTVVSVRQDCARIAVSSAYSASCEFGEGVRGGISEM